MTSWWRRLPRRRRITLGLLLTIVVLWVLFPGFWWPVVVFGVAIGGQVAEAMADRRYLRDARARDLAESPEP